MQFFKGNNDLHLKKNDHNVMNVQKQLVSKLDAVIYSNAPLTMKVKLLGLTDQTQIVRTLHDLLTCTRVSETFPPTKTYAKILQTMTFN